MASSNAQQAAAHRAQMLATANQTWFSVFNGGAYTSLPMIDLMMTSVGSSSGALAGYANMLKNPKAILGKSNKTVDKDDFANWDLSSVTNTASGRCTSFAIYVAALLDHYHPNDYDWHYYDLKGHRIAVDHNSWIVLDSSSQRGAVQLPADATWTNYESDQKWKFKKEEKSGKTFFETVNRAGDKTQKSSREAISTNRCMRICMAEVANRATALCYFRAWQANSVPEFFGMISFNNAATQFELVPDMKERQANRIIILFRNHKNEQQFTPDEAMVIMDAFADAPATGGPHGAAQWRAAGVRATMASIMSVAAAKYGNPYLST